MSKVLVIESKVTPDVGGYGDKLAILDDNKLTYHCECSCCPNPFSPILRTKWSRNYGWLACSTYSWLCIQHRKYKKCLILNSGGRCNTRLSNPKQDGNYFMRGVFVHKGFTEKWRGSAGCITVPPRLWVNFISYFVVDEVGILRIVDFSKVTNSDKQPMP
jgi:hypothetical protein